MSQHAEEACGLIFRVPAVPEQSVGNSALGKQTLRRHMFFREPKRRALAVEDACVGNEFHAGFGRSLDGGGVLGQAAPDFVG